MYTGIAIHLQQKNEAVEGNENVPFSIYRMTEENVIKHLGELVDDILQEDPSLFRVAIKVKPVNNIKVFVDGDNGIPIEKCVK